MRYYVVPRQSVPLGQAPAVPWGATLGTIVIFGGLLWWAMGGSAKKSKSRSSNGKPYWVWGYNHPKGHVDRRVKAGWGPYRTKSEAQRVAEIVKEASGTPRCAERSPNERPR